MCQYISTYRIQKNVISRYSTQFIDMLSHIKDNNHSIIFTTNHNDNHTVGVNIKKFDEQSDSYSVDIDNIAEENDDLNATISSVTQVWVDNCT